MVYDGDGEVGYGVGCCMVQNGEGGGWLMVVKVWWKMVYGGGWCIVKGYEWQMK